MTSQPRSADLTERLGALLRRLSPPRHVAGNPQALQDEVQSLNRIINQRAPSHGYVDWWGKFEDELLRRAKTRAWPIVAEVEAAAQAIAIQTRQAQAPGQDGIEMAAIDRMVGWFRQFRCQMPGHGKPSRTAALIAQGVLASERDARFYGFDLSPDQRRLSDDQPPGRDEQNHHLRLMADLQAIADRNAAQRDEIARRRAATKPQQEHAA